MGDRLGLPGAVYTRTCCVQEHVACSDVVWLREPRKSDGSARLTELELEVKEPQ